MPDYVNFADFDFVAGVYESECYDWNEGQLMRHKESGVLFFGRDSGCSCSGFGDHLYVEDLIQVDNWHSAVDVAKDEGFTEGAIVEFAQACMDAFAGKETS